MKLRIALLAVCAVGAGSALAKPQLPIPDLASPPQAEFSVFVDASGAGWAVHDAPGIGARLWGCNSVANLEECRDVRLDPWFVGSTVEVLYVSEDSLAAWVTTHHPVHGDSLFACYEPAGVARCTEVPLSLRPPRTTLSRVWPPQPPMNESVGVLEPAKSARLLIAVGTVPAGEVNLAACRGLRNALPECVIGVPGWLTIDRGGLGIDKVEEVTTDAGWVSIRIVGIATRSPADAAGLQEGDLITAVAGHRLRGEEHFRGLLMQTPATHEVRITVEGRGDFTLSPARKTRD